MAIVLLIAQVVVIIYGYVIYFSADNDCQEHPDMVFWLVIMILVLVYGLLPILALALLICCAPILFCIMRQQRDLQDR